MDDAPTLHFDAQHRLAIAHLAGFVDTNLLAQLTAQVQALEESAPAPFDRLFDLTGVTELHLNGPEIYSIAKARRAATAHRPRVRTALVATHPIANGLARVYETLMEGSQIEAGVFWSTKLAADWLGVPEEAVKADALHTH